MPEVKDVKPAITEDEELGHGKGRQEEEKRHEELSEEEKQVREPGDQCYDFKQYFGSNWRKRW
jgi:hypothetical protein